MQEASKIKASIIIPTYNRSSQLHLTLGSILRQVNIDALEVIVVDDGSSDDSFLVAKAFAQKMRLKYVYQDDRGFRVASARNIGIKNATSDICILLDSGVLMESRCAEEHISIHAGSADPVAVIGYVYGFDNNDADCDELTELIHRHADIDETIRRLDLTEKFLDIREEEYRQYDYRIDHLPAPWAYFWTCQVSINKKSHVSGDDFFDERFEPHYGYEDVDLGYRLHCAGTRIYLGKMAKAIHFPHKKKHDYKKDSSLNAKFFLQKHDTEMVRLFSKNDGTFGFNGLIRKLYPGMEMDQLVLSRPL